MYEVKGTNGLIAYVEEPRYIKQSANGSYIQTDRENAKGIALNGDVYHIIGRESLEGSDDDVTVEYVDGGVVIASIKPYEQTQTAYYGESGKNFYDVPEGNITVFWNNYAGDYSVQRFDGGVNVSFETLTVAEATITISVQ